MDRAGGTFDGIQCVNCGVWGRRRPYPGSGSLVGACETLHRDADAVSPITGGVDDGILIGLLRRGRRNGIFFSCSLGGRL